MQITPEQKRLIENMITNLVVQSHELSNVTTSEYMADRIRLMRTSLKHIEAYLNIA